MIYADEAGTAPAEPVRVVACVIIEGDDQWRSIDHQLSRVIRESVPELYRNGFIFHGKEVFNGGKHISRYEWAFNERLDFFKEVVSLPFAYDLPVSLGVVWSDMLSGGEGLPDFIANGTVKKQHYEHLMAFGYSLERADHFLRKYLSGCENGVVIAEDLPENRALLARGGLVFREAPYELPSSGLTPNIFQDMYGLTPPPVHYQIKHIIDAPHFAKKGQASLLQLADACAFAFRRYLSRLNHGEDLILSMLGPKQGPAFVAEPAWFDAVSSGLFNVESYVTDEIRAKNVEAFEAAMMAKALCDLLMGEPD
ncbi:DUF3800 domain-containing protein [Croceibacterium ferulae]|uniref:DUF3800 domain-containing protein n=1 Tax=Croceibacterium ferulae TaxID=1854641 RepID=UPI000F89D296|nr:DUF3800 domain-containing protein [Croceibacterium ferulae]